MSGAKLLTQVFHKPSAIESEIHPSHKSSICTLGISPLQGAKSRRRDLYKCYRIWGNAGYGIVFVNGQPKQSTHLYNPSTSFPKQHFWEEEALSKEIHLFGWASSTMSVAGLLIYPVTPSRKICMQSMKPQTATTGRSLPDLISRNFWKAVRKGNVLQMSI